MKINIRIKKRKSIVRKVDKEEEQTHGGNKNTEVG
jgi:hypothetical protein